MNNQYYVVFSNDPTQSTQPAFPISHLERDLYNKQADIDKALIKLYQENRIASKDALSEKLTFFNDEQMTRLYAHLQDKGYIKNEIDGNPYVSLPSVGTYDQPVSKNDVFSVLKRHGVIDSNGHILDVSKLDPGQACRRDIDRLFSRGLTGAQYGELLRQDLRSRNQPDALHLTSSAAADTESSSGFQVLDADMVNLARKNFMLMNAVRRVYMSLVSAQTQFFERIASKLSKDATSSSHYSDMQSSLMESHMGIAERQLSSIQSDTTQMVSRINDLHKMRLNIIKLRILF